MLLFSSHRTSGRPGRDRIVVSTSRCGRDNPGSNPGHGKTTAKPTLFLVIRSVNISEGLGLHFIRPLNKMAFSSSHMYLSDCIVSVAKSRQLFAKLMGLSGI